MRVNKKLINSFRITGIILSLGLLIVLIFGFLNILNIKSIIPVMLIFIGMILSICASCESQVNHSFFVQLCSFASLALAVCGGIMVVVQITQGSFNLIL